MIVRTIIHRIKHARSVSDAMRWFQAVWTWVKAGCRYKSQEEALQRLSICKDCPEIQYDEDGDGRCSQCGCWLVLAKGFERSFSKLYFPGKKGESACPLDRWKRD